MRHERSRTMATVKVAEVSDVPVGTGKVVQAGGKTLALFNLGARSTPWTIVAPTWADRLAKGQSRGTGSRAPGTAVFSISPTARWLGLPRVGRWRPFQYTWRGIKS